MKPTVSHLVRWKKMHMSLQSRGWASSGLLKDSGADTEMFRGREGSASRTELSELAAHWLAAHAPRLPACSPGTRVPIISSTLWREGTFDFPGYPDSINSQALRIIPLSKAPTPQEKHATPDYSLQGVGLMVKNRRPRVQKQPGNKWKFCTISRCGYDGIDKPN